MYIYIHVYMYTCIYISMYLYNNNIYIYIYIYTYVCMYLHRIDEPPLHDIQSVNPDGTFLYIWVLLLLTFFMAMLRMDTLGMCHANVQASYNAMQRPACCMKLHGGMIRTHVLTDFAGRDSPGPHLGPHHSSSSSSSCRSAAAAAAGGCPCHPIPPPLHRHRWAMMLWCVRHRCVRLWCPAARLV